MTKERVSKTSSSLKLLVPVEEATRRIEGQIEIGLDIRDQTIFSHSDLGKIQKSRVKWLETNIEMVTHLFDNSSFIEEYRKGISFEMESGMTFGLMEKDFRDDINEQIYKLRSLLHHLKPTPEHKGEALVEQKLVGEPISQEQPQEIQLQEIQLQEIQLQEVPARERKPDEEPPMEKRPVEKLLEKLLKKKPSKELSSKERQQEEELLKEVPNRIERLREEVASTIGLEQSPLLKSNILLAHGRNETLKKPLLEFIEKLELKASILPEQPNGAKPVIERLGEFPNIHFAIFLFTSDDFALPRDKPKEKQTHVSQNVIFELGCFVGRLGPGKVCALCEEGLEIPLDDSGVVCVPMDSRGGWKLLIAKEIKQAGIEIDLNKLI
jgi:predicted nucleotide-binding protein